MNSKRHSPAESPGNLTKTLVFVGMMGAGKTAVGQAVARKLGVPFVDQDDEIEKAADRKIAEIFQEHGEPFFRAKETQVLERLLKDEPCVLSTGGGAFLSEKNRDLISQYGAAVWLNAELNLLWSRVRHKSTRPLLHTDDPFGTLREIYHERTPIYALAPIQVTARSNYSIDDMAEAVLKALTETPGLIGKPDHAAH